MRKPEYGIIFKGGKNMFTIAHLDSYTVLFLLVVTQVIITLVFAYLSIRDPKKGFGLLTIAFTLSFASYILNLNSTEGVSSLTIFSSNIAEIGASIYVILGILKLLGYRIPRLAPAALGTLSVALLTFFSFQTQSSYGVFVVISSLQIVLSIGVIIHLFHYQKAGNANTTTYALTLFYSLYFVSRVIGIIQLYEYRNNAFTILNIRFYEHLMIFNLFFVIFRAFVIIILISVRYNNDMNLKNMQLEQLTYTDSLTGLRNKRFIQETLSNEIKRSSRSNSIFCVALLDIDGFKNINDTYGHLFGDEVLKSFGNSIRTRLRCTDEVARYGGDEFIIVLPDTKMADCRKLFSDIQASVLKQQIGDTKISISFSVGIKEINGNESIEEIILEVDSLMYREKNFKK